MNLNSENIDSVVIEVIKSIAFTPKSLDVLLDTFAKQASISGANVLDEKSKSALKSQFVSEAFLSQFVERFKTHFSNDEIHDLLRIYQSGAMKKWFEVGQTLFEPMYSAMSKQVEEMTRN